MWTTYHTNGWLEFTPHITGCAKSAKYIDMMVHHIPKAHRALCANGFHVSGRRESRKAWTRMPDYGTVKLDLHEDPIQVASVDIRETVERVNVALERPKFTLTLKGLAQPSRLFKLSKDRDGAIWLANSLAAQGTENPSKIMNYLNLCGESEC